MATMTGRTSGPASCSYLTERQLPAARMRPRRLQRGAAPTTVCSSMKPSKVQVQLQELLQTHTQRLERLLQAAPPAAQLHMELTQELRQLKQALAAAVPEAAATATTAVADSSDPRALAQALSADLAQVQQRLLVQGEQPRMGKTEKDCMDGESSSSSSSSDSEDEEERMQRKQEKKQRKMEKKAAKQKMKGRGMAMEGSTTMAVCKAAGTGSTAAGSSTAVLERPPHAPAASATAPTASSSTATQPRTPAATVHQLPVPQLWDESQPATSAPAQLPEGATGRVLVCQGSKCSRSGAHVLLQEASRAVAGAPGVEVLPCKCLGKCKMGPAMKVRPQGQQAAMFTHVEPERVGELVERAFAEAAPEAPVAVVEFGKAVPAAPVF